MLRAVFLLLAAAATAATSAFNVDNKDWNHGSSVGLTTFPLVPHREYVTRRERERRHLGFIEEEMLDEEDIAPRPHRYGRHLAGKQQLGALYQGYGTHYVDVWVGTPMPQRQTVIVDTGSGVTAFPCSECRDCGESYHTDGYFIEASSDSFEQLSCNDCERGRCSTWNNQQVCRISMSYQEGSSWSAYEGRDWAYVGGPHDEPLESGISITQNSQGSSSSNGDDPYHASDFAFQLVFGCQTSLTGLFKTQLADGIMGMDNGNNAFWRQMSSASAVDERQFSLCFSKQPEASKEGTLAGTLTMGGVDPRLHETPMVYAKNLHATGFYTVRLRNIYLREGGGQTALSEDLLKVRRISISENDLNSGEVIVDSGTTDTYFVSRLATPFKEAWKQVLGTDYNHNKVALTNEQLDALPTILFQIEGDGSNVDDPLAPNLAGNLDPANPRDVVIAMPARHYMEYSAKEGLYTARFYLEEGSGSVIGANAMMGHDVLFDIDNQRIGFAESKCDYFELTGLKPPSSSGGWDDSGSSGGSCSWWCWFLIVIAIIGACICCALCYKRREETKMIIVEPVPHSEVDAEDRDLTYDEDHEGARFVDGDDRSYHSDDMNENVRYGDHDVHDGGDPYMDDGVQDDGRYEEEIRSRASYRDEEEIHSRASYRGEEDIHSRASYRGEEDIHSRASYRGEEDIHSRASYREDEDHYSRASYREDVAHEGVGYGNEQHLPPRMT